MITYTKEQLIAQAEGNITMLRVSLDHVKDQFERDEITADLRLAETALAALTAEPVAWRYRHHNGLAPSNWRFVDSEDECNLAPNYQRQPLYTAPPAPVVPDDGRAEFEEWFKFHHSDEHSIVTLRRANGGANYLDPHVDLAWIAWKNSRAAMQGKAEPVSQRDELPEGWVAVPVDPTKEMIDAGWMYFMGAKNPSSKGTYKAMLAAAPQLEVK